MIKGTYITAQGAVEFDATEWLIKQAEAYAKSLEVSTGEE